MLATALALEAFGVAIAVGFVSVFGEVSALGQTLAWVVGASALAWVVPVALAADWRIDGTVGGLMLGGLALVQLGLIAFLAWQVAGFADPNVGVASRSIAIRFVSMLFPVLILTGTTVLLLRYFAGEPETGESSPWKTRVTGVGAAAGVLCLLGAGVAGSSGATGLGCEVFSFDRGTWDSEESQKRQRIAHNLIDCNLLEGESRATAVRMLGAPDTENRMRVTWRIGDIPGLVFSSSSWLEVRLQDGTIARARIGTVSANYAAD